VEVAILIYVEPCSPIGFEITQGVGVGTKKDIEAKLSSRQCRGVRDRLTLKSFCEMIKAQNEKRR